MKTDQSYVDEIISCVQKYGPYIVILPGVAMPHASATSEGVFETAISLTKLSEPVFFEEKDGEKKSAALFFTLAAKNSEAHLENIQNLSELLMIEGLVERLLETKSIVDYQKIMEEFKL